VSGKTYVVATVKPWNLDLYRERHGRLPGQWHLIQSKDELTADRLRTLNPRYVFFPHWSWIVPKDVLDLCECVCFHMTDVPFGRGGSPLQNLIVRGVKETRLTALRMEPGLDTGPVYMKRPLALDGTAQDIFVRAAHVVWDMIAEMVKNEPASTPQVGDPVIFTRRTPAQSVLPEGGASESLYDHIRMLDAETYPHAFIEHGEWRIELTDAALSGDGVTARAVIKRKPT
jgi:methionyl-tRNA formyltransferase